MENLQEYVILYGIFSILIILIAWLGDEVIALKKNDKVNDNNFNDLSGQIVELNRQINQLVEEKNLTKVKRRKIGRAHV